MSDKNTTSLAEVTITDKKITCIGCLSQACGSTALC